MTSELESRRFSSFISFLISSTWSFVAKTDIMITSDGLDFYTLKLMKLDVGSIRTRAAFYLKRGNITMQCTFNGFSLFWKMFFNSEIILFETSF